MRNFLAVSLTLATIGLAPPVSASEADFLQALSGEWSGSGSIRLQPEDEPVNVSCDLSSQAGDATVSMGGTCTALIVASRQIGADLSVDGASYSGTYIGSVHGPATLAGNRSGDTINLAVAWAETGREAAMSLSSTGDEMQIMTSEAHPDTGEQVVTAQLSFQRQ